MWLRRLQKLRGRRLAGFLDHLPMGVREVHHEQSMRHGPVFVLSAAKKIIESLSALFKQQDQILTHVLRLRVADRIKALFKLELQTY